MKAQSIKAGEGSSGILREETASMLVSTKPAQPVSTEVAKTEAGNPSPIMPVPVNTAASTALNTDGVEKEDVVAMYALDMIQMYQNASISFTKYSFELVIEALLPLVQFRIRVVL
eukprot:159197-Prorocentrum_minimum.AAC.2